MESNSGWIFKGRALLESSTRPYCIKFVIEIKLVTPPFLCGSCLSRMRRNLPRGDASRPTCNGSKR